MLTKTMMVSVIIPNYNHSLYLTQRIDSVLGQTYQDIEVIILDDCSTDNSLSIIEKYRNNKKISHIIINEKNVGSPFMQWEKGLSIARGEFIWIAESDDTADKYFLENLVSIIQDKEDISVAFANSHIIDSDGNIFDDFDVDDKEYPEVSFHTGSDFINYKMTNFTRIYNASSAIFRRKSWELIPRYYSKFRSSGDYLFWIELLNTGNVAWLHKKLNLFRKHNNNVTVKSNKNGLNFIERREQLMYFKENNYFNNWQLSLMIGGEFYALNHLPSNMKKLELRRWMSCERKFLWYALLWFSFKIQRRLLIKLRIINKYPRIPGIYGKH